MYVCIYVCSYSKMNPARPQLGGFLLLKDKPNTSKSQATAKGCDDDDDEDDEGTCMHTHDGNAAHVQLFSLTLAMPLALMMSISYTTD